MASIFARHLGELTVNLSGIVFFYGFLRQCPGENVCFHPFSIFNSSTSPYIATSKLKSALNNTKHNN